MSVIGMGTVFVALAFLVAFVSLTARILARRDSTATSVSNTAAAASDHSESQDDERLLKVAVAAYGFHLSQRVNVRGHVASSPWLHAGRQSQVGRVPSRG